MKIRNDDGRINVIIPIVVLLIIIAIITIVIVNKNKSKIVEPVQVEESLFEYFVLYSADDKVGVIDKEGNKVIDTKYSTIYIPNQSKDVFICFEDEENYVILNKTGEEIFTDYEEVFPINYVDSSDMEKEVMLYKEDEKYGLISFDGKKVTDAKYDKISSLVNKQGSLLVKKDNLYGVLDSKGNVIIDVKYNSIRGDEYYTQIDGYKKTGYIVSEKTSDGIIYGYINYKGKVMIKPEYESISRCLDYDSEDIYLIFMDNGKKGVIKNKSEIISPKFQQIIYYNLSNIFAVSKNNKYGFYNQKGEEILPVQYTEYSVAGEYISVKKDDDMRLYDFHGNLVNTNTYRSIIETNNPAYFIAIDENNYYSIISKEKTIANDYAEITYAYDNFFIYRTQENLVGVLNIFSGIEIEAKYDSILVLENVDAIEAKLGDVSDIYSKKIEKMASVKNAKIQSVGKDFAVVYSDSDRYYLNKDGEVVENIEVYPKKELYAYQDDNYKWGFCDKNKTVVVPCTYDMVTEFNEYGFAGVLLGGKWGVIDLEGIEIVSPQYEIETYYEPSFVGKYLCNYSEDNVCCEEL